MAITRIVDVSRARTLSLGKGPNSAASIEDTCRVEIACGMNEMVSKALVRDRVGGKADP